MKRVAPGLLTAFFLIVIAREDFSQVSNPSTPADGKTQVVLLGTGTPNADPDRSGPSVAIVVNDTPYVVDFGPGVVRRAAAAHRRGVGGLAVSKLKTAFATHLHYSRES